MVQQFGASFQVVRERQPDTRAQKTYRPRKNEERKDLKIEKTVFSGRDEEREKV